jgi:hypothetical protein
VTHALGPRRPGATHSCATSFAIGAGTAPAVQRFMDLYDQLWEPMLVTLFAAFLLFASL